MIWESILKSIRGFYGISEQTEEIQWTFSLTYQRRIEQVKTGWIIAGLLMLAIESLAFVIGCFLFCFFLSLAFLERG